MNWLGDVGGLLDGLSAIGSVFLTIYSFILGNPLESFLLESVFKTESNFNENNQSSRKQKVEMISRRKSFKMNLLPLCRNPNQRRMEDLGLARINKVLEIDEFLKL